MKVKQVPKSLARMINLLRIPLNDLGKSAVASEVEVIISLTSIPYRLPKLHLVVRSLLSQTVSFKKVILWLNTDLTNRIPNKLKVLQSERFEIRFCSGTSSHRKLTETLKIYPHDYIVTCDDDVMYSSDWLSRLLDEHRRHPKAVVAHMCRVFCSDDNGLLPYRDWSAEAPGQGSDRTLAIGCAGVLYPPNSLHDDVLNESLFLKLAPKADDFWFKAMSFKRGTRVVKTRASDSEPTPIMFTQKYALKRRNIEGDENNEQWNSICDYYGLEIK